MSTKRYQFTDEDRRRGGKSTAAKYDMRERGIRGLQSFADKYCKGDLDRAGKLLSRAGNWFTDAAWWNGAFGLPANIHPDLQTKLINKRFPASPESAQSDPDLMF